MNDVNYIDLSGYSYTGKSAVYGLLSEVSEVKLFGIETEFDLVRSQSGLVNLYHHLVVNWSPVRSSSAIRNFIHLVKVTQGDGSFFSRLFDSGYMYSKYFPEFRSASNRYINSLLLTSYRAYWPFYSTDYYAMSIFFNKLRHRFLTNKSEEVYLSRQSEDRFFHLTALYLSEIFQSIPDFHSYTNLVFNNCFEPFSSQFMDKLNLPFRQVVVDRDPRDVYMSALKSANKDASSAILGGGIDDFIVRYKTFRQDGNLSKNCLKVNFENLVLDYDNTIGNIFSFLDISPLRHVDKTKYFNPCKSSAGVGSWKSVSDKVLLSNINLIEKKLSNYLVEI